MILPSAIKTYFLLTRDGNQVLALHAAASSTDTAEAMKHCRRHAGRRATSATHQLLLYRAFVSACTDIHLLGVGCGIDFGF